MRKRRLEEFILDALTARSYNNVDIPVSCGVAVVL